MRRILFHPEKRQRVSIPFSSVLWAQDYLSDFPFSMGFGGRDVLQLWSMRTNSVDGKLEGVTLVFLVSEGGRTIKIRKTLKAMRDKKG